MCPNLPPRETFGGCTLRHDAPQCCRTRFASLWSAASGAAFWDQKKRRRSPHSKDQTAKGTRRPDAAPHGRVYLVSRRLGRSSGGEKWCIVPVSADRGPSLPRRCQMRGHKKGTRGDARLSEPPKQVKCARPLVCGFYRQKNHFSALCPGSLSRRMGWAVAEEHPSLH